MSENRSLEERLKELEEEFTEDTNKVPPKLKKELINKYKKKINSLDIKINRLKKPKKKMSLKKKIIYFAIPPIILISSLLPYAKNIDCIKNMRVAGFNNLYNDMVVELKEGNIFKADDIATSIQKALINEKNPGLKEIYQKTAELDDKKIDPFLDIKVFYEKSPRFDDLYELVDVSLIQKEVTVKTRLQVFQGEPGNKQIINYGSYEYIDMNVNFNMELLKKDLEKEACRIAAKKGFDAIKFNNKTSELKSSIVDIVYGGQKDRVFYHRKIMAEFYNKK